MLVGQALRSGYFVTLKCKHVTYTTTNFIHFDHLKCRVTGMKSPSICQGLSHGDRRAWSNYAKLIGRGKAE